MQHQPVYECQCPCCTSPGDHPERRLHHQMNLLLSRLDEQQRRWYVALEAMWRGHGGDRFMSQVTEMSEPVIRRGRRELAADLEGRPIERIRLPGGGRPRIEQKDPEVEPSLLKLVESETAGDPMSGKKWSRKTLRKLSAEMREAKHPVSFSTVRRLLKKSGYSLKVNAKRKEAKVSHPDREAQFTHIEEQKKDFLAAGDPVISVDTKKELIGELEQTSPGLDSVGCRGRKSGTV